MAPWADITCVFMDRRKFAYPPITAQFLGPLSGTAQRPAQFWDKRAKTVEKALLQLGDLHHQLRDQLDSVLTEPLPDDLKELVQQLYEHEPSPSSDDPWLDDCSHS